MSEDKEEKNNGSELSISDKGIIIKGGAYEDIRPLVKSAVAVGAPILMIMANALAISHGWMTSRLEGVAKRYNVKLLEMPENQRQLPPPEVTAAVINRAIYAGDDPVLHELFAELLVSASDSTRVGQAHVAFATVLGVES